MSGVLVIKSTIPGTLGLIKELPLKNYIISFVDMSYYNESNTYTLWVMNGNVSKSIGAPVKVSNPDNDTTKSGMYCFVDQSKRTIRLYQYVHTGWNANLIITPI